MVLHAEPIGAGRASSGDRRRRRAARPVSARETKHGLSELVVLAAYLGGVKRSGAQRASSGARVGGRPSPRGWVGSRGGRAGGSGACRRRASAESPGGPRARRRPWRSRRPSLAAGPSSSLVASGCRAAAIGAPRYSLPLRSSQLLISRAVGGRSSAADRRGRGLAAGGTPRRLAIWLDVVVTARGRSGTGAR